MWYDQGKKWWRWQGSYLSDEENGSTILVAGDTATAVAEKEDDFKEMVGRRSTVATRRRWRSWKDGKMRGRSWKDGKVRERSWKDGKMRGRDTRQWPREMRQQATDGDKRRAREQRQTG